MATPSLWTEQDTATLRELVRKRGFADVTLALREIAQEREKNERKVKADWVGIMTLLTRIFDNITERRPLPSKLDG
jgi:predicted lipid-binding transport protein (Tim44 family)